jgi:hypothetical protein
MDQKKLGDPTVLRWWKHFKCNRRMVGDTHCSGLSTAITNVSIKEADDLLMQVRILKMMTIICTQSCEQLIPSVYIIISCCVRGKL